MTAEDFGGDPMSVNLKEYFDKQFEVLDEKVDKLSDKVEGLQCGEHGGRLIKIEQQLASDVKAEDNIHKNKIERLTMWRIGIAIIGVAIVILEIWDKIK